MALPSALLPSCCPRLVALRYTQAPPGGSRRTTSRTWPGGSQSSPGIGTSPATCPRRSRTWTKPRPRPQCWPPTTRPLLPTRERWSWRAATPAARAWRDGISDWGRSLSTSNARTQPKGASTWRRGSPSSGWHRRAGGSARYSEPCGSSSCRRVTGSSAQGSLRVRGVDASSAMRRVHTSDSSSCTSSRR